MDTRTLNIISKTLIKLTKNYDKEGRTVDFGDGPVKVFVMPAYYLNRTDIKLDKSWTRVVFSRRFFSARIREIYVIWQPGDTVEDLVATAYEHTMSKVYEHTKDHKIHALEKLTVTVLG